MGTRAVSTADEIATLATQYDMTSDALGRFNYVALQTDTDAEMLYKSFVKMRAGIADIATGTTTQASTALQQLGIDLNSFGSSEEQFYAIITALADMGDRTQMVAIANDLFGEKLANNLLPLIYSGSDAIRTYADEYENLGALSGEQVDALAEFDNVLNTLKTQFSNVALQIGSALLPVMQTIADFVKNEVLPKLQALAEWFSSLSIEQQEFALKALAVLAVLGPVTVGIGKMTSAVGDIVGMLPKLKSGLSQLAEHPIILIIGAVVAVLALLYTRCESFRESVNALIGVIGSALAPVLSAVMGLLSSLFELLMPILDILGGILGMVIGLVTEALSPILESLSLLFGLIGPLIEVALIPLQLALSAISIPLNLLGTLLGWLSPLFVVFGEVVNGVFNGIIYIVNFVLGFIEGAINGCIGLINGLIDGINAALGWLGVSIGHIDEVKLRIDTAEIENMDDVEAQIKPAPSDSGEAPLPTTGTVYDLLGAGSSSGDVYNNDYSTTNTTQNVTVVIENYAAEVDVDALVSEINIKLAEAM